MQKCSHTISSKELFMQRMKARRRYWGWGREPTSSNLLRTLRTSPTLNLGAHCPPQSTLICWWRMTSDHFSFTGLHLNLNGGWNWGPSWPFWHSTIPHMRWGKNRRRRVKEAFKNYLAIFSVKGVPSAPPTPLTENHFAKKPLAERGGTPPLNGKLPKVFLKKRVKKG